MKEELINDIVQEMAPHLDSSQKRILNEVLVLKLWNLNLVDATNDIHEKKLQTNSQLLSKFLTAKKIEGCSEKTLRYYKATISKALKMLNLHIANITTDDLRQYLSDYQEVNNCSKMNIDNIRRILSSFFTWLEDEDYILKNPIRRIRKIKTTSCVKEPYTDETVEIIRDGCSNIRDLAIVDILSSTGMRVGELVKLNISDIDFDNRECVVIGKGGKERPVYFDAHTKIHLKNYLVSRTDDNPALFVSLQRPFKRLEISGVEIRLRELGKKLGLEKVHPHRFRRTLATRAIDKGMPIEQVQKLLGHSKIDSTMLYAMVSQNNVKMSHRKCFS